MRYREPRHGVRVVAGRVRDGLHVLRDRPGRVRPPPRRRRDRRAGGAGPARLVRSACRNVVFMGMGEPLANYDAVWASVERLHDDLGHLGPPHHGQHRRRRARDAPPGARSRSRSRSRCRSTRPTTSCATRSCRSTAATRSPRCSTPPPRSPGARGRRVSSSTRASHGVNDRPDQADALGPPPRRAGPGSAAPTSTSSRSTPRPGSAAARPTPGRVRGLRRGRAPARGHRDDPPQPRHRHRRRLRPAPGPDADGDCRAGPADPDGAVTTPLPTGQNGPVNDRKFVNQFQPQTLYIATCCSTSTRCSTS